MPPGPGEAVAGPRKWGEAWTQGLGAGLGCPWDLIVAAEWRGMGCVVTGITAGRLVVSADGPWPRVEDRGRRAHSGSSIPVLQDGKVLELYCPKWKCTLR